MKRTQHSGCFIFLTELDWLNFALDTGADFHWLNTEQLYLDVSLYSNPGIEKFSWGWISIRIRYSTNGKVNIRIQRMRIFFHFDTSLVCVEWRGWSVLHAAAVQSVLRRWWLFGVEPAFWCAAAGDDWSDDAAETALSCSWRYLLQGKFCAPSVLLIKDSFMLWSVLAVLCCAVLPWWSRPVSEEVLSFVSVKSPCPLCPGWRLVT